MTADEVIAAARSCLATPFRHQGRIPGVALDCAGLVVAVARALGLDPVDREGYARTPAHGVLEQALDSQPCLRRLESKNLQQPGDVLLMRFDSDPQHLAILTADHTIIHSYANVGACVEHRFSNAWISRVCSVYRFSDLT